MRFIICILGFIHCASACELYIGLDNDLPQSWSTAFAYFVKHGDTLHNARINGNYTGPDHPGARKEWRQSTFESERPGDPGRRLENSLNYPLDPIAAFIQWCYPSPSRTTLSANTNCQDPLGIWARNMTSSDLIVKDQAIKTMGCMIRLIQDLYNNHAYAKYSNDNLESLGRLFYGNFFDQPYKLVFQKSFKALFDSQVIQERYIDAFTDIAYKAIKNDAFDSVSKLFYTPCIVRQTLNTYILDIVTNIEDLAAIYKYAKMLPENYQPKPITPLTKELYQEISERIETTDADKSIVDLVMYDIGRKKFAAHLPPFPAMQRAVVTINEKELLFADCGENAIMNFF